MLRRMKLSTRLLVAFLLVGLIPFSVIGIAALLNSSDALSNQSFAQLEGIREIKKARIERFFSDRQGEMDVLVDTVTTLKQAAFDKLAVVQQIKKTQVEEYFKERFNDIIFFSKNRFVAEALQKFQSAFDSEDGKVDTPIWQYMADECSSGLSEFKDRSGYNDLYLISEEGDIVYTVSRHSDLGQNLVSGTLKGSPLAKCFKKALEGPAVQDFEPYEPAGNRLSAFTGAPVVVNGMLVGVIALQVPAESINAIVQQREGMGKSGETYLVGEHEDRVALRSDMLTMGNGTYVVGHEIRTKFADRALSGEKGEKAFTDSSGNLVMVAYAPLDIRGLNWACISKIDMEEAIAPLLKGETDDFFANYVKKYGYSDLYLIHPEGKVFYSVAHADDYGADLLKGEPAESGLGRLTRNVLETKRFGMSDFAPYAPRGNEPAAFIEQPLMEGDDVELLVALQLSLDAINSIMQMREGMGETGETYLVGTDAIMRSDSYLDPEHHSVKASFADPAKGRVETEASREALSGKSGERIVTSYHGKSVLSAYAPLQVGDTVWALIAEIDESEAFAGIREIKWLIGIFAIIGVLAIVLFAWIFTRSISRPINRVIEGLSDGAAHVTSASSQVSSASNFFADGASQQAASIEQTFSSLKMLASATQQNAEHARRADGLMKETNRVVTQANNSMAELTASMLEISKASEETSAIIKTIDDIAFQTNLLALNAAVEAARAGEAGAGFAVVADEVRNLAMRAAQAAQNTAALIDRTVEKIKDGTSLVAKTNDAFVEVASNTTEVGDLVSGIADESDEQYLSIEQANTAVDEMHKLTQQNVTTAEESASASEEMNAQAEELKTYVQELVNLVSGDAEKDTRTIVTSPLPTDPVNVSTRAAAEPRRPKQITQAASPEDTSFVDQ